VVTAAAHLGVDADAFEAQRRTLWSDVRNRRAVRRPATIEGAIMTRATRTFARRGTVQ